MGSSWLPRLLLSGLLGLAGCAASPEQRSEVVQSVPAGSPVADPIIEAAEPPSPPSPTSPPGRWSVRLASGGPADARRLVATGVGLEATGALSLQAAGLPPDWQLGEQSVWAYAEQRAAISATLTAPAPLQRAPVTISGPDGDWTTRVVPEQVEGIPSFFPTVDGDLSDWPSLPQAILQPRQILFSAEAWTGPLDSAAVFGLAYDFEYLYIAVLVRDDRLVTDHGSWAWDQDAVEIRVNAMPDPARSRCDGKNEGRDFIYLGIIPGEQPEARTVHLENRLPKDISIASGVVPGGHATEVAIPRAYLDAKQGEDWSLVRLNVAINDFDGAVGDRTEGSQLWWWPDWRTAERVDGSGTFVKPNGPMAAR